MQEEIMIGIISAMQIENDEILKLCRDVKKKVIASHDFYEAVLSDEKVVLALSGCGKTNAAITTTLMMEHYPIDVILNIGTAGGLKKEEKVLDCVLSTSVVQHDFDTSALDGENGKGIFYSADPQLLNLVKKNVDEMKIPFHLGLIASGDQFVSTPEQVEKILHDFPDSLCAEMEAGGIAAVASNYGVPFVVLRSLSDVAVKEGNEMDFMEYAKTASKRSAELCEKCVNQYKRK